MTQDKPALEFGADAVLRVSREGGFAPVPGLSAPREITAAACPAALREHLAACLADDGAAQRAGRGDQRYWRVELLGKPGARKASASTVIAEDAAPAGLAELWEHAGQSGAG